MNNEIESFMKATLDNLKDILNTQTVVGECIYAPDKSVIVPISKISFGFVTGGGEYGEINSKVENPLPVAGGGGGGVSIKPVGFLILKNGSYELINIENNGGNEKWGDLISSAIKKITKNMD